MTETQTPTTKTVRPSPAQLKVFRRMIEEQDEKISRYRYYPPHEVAKTNRASYLTQAERDALRTPEIERMERRLHEIDKERDTIVARVRELTMMVSGVDVDNVTIIPSLDHPAERAARAAHEAACDEKRAKLDALRDKTDRLMLGVGGFEDLLAELDSI